MLTSLKYINEDPPVSDYLRWQPVGGVLHPRTSFPAGKVDFWESCLLSLFKFIMAMGKERYAKLLRRGDFDIATAFKQNSY